MEQKSPCQDDNLRQSGLANGFYNCNQYCVNVPQKLVQSKDEQENGPHYSIAYAYLWPPQFFSFSYLSIHFHTQFQFSTTNGMHWN